MNRWLLEARPQFLVLSVLLVAHGTALALAAGHTIDWLHVLLATIGLVLLHAAVNALNDWHDYSRSGIDRHVRQTPFSGGSGLLPAGTLAPRHALLLGVSTLVAGAGIGLCLAWVAGPPLLIIGAVGVLSVVLYTPIFTRVGLGEFFAGFALGTLPVVGVYYLLTGHLDSVAWVSGIPAGLLTYNLLLLNEFPDADADTAGGRKHLVILLGKRSARWLYALVEIAVYVSILLAVALGALPAWALVGLGGTYFAVRAVRMTMAEYEGFETLFPAMGMNVNAVLSTNALMAVGYAIRALVR